MDTEEVDGLKKFIERLKQPGVTALIFTKHRIYGSEATMVMQDNVELKTASQKQAIIDQLEKILEENLVT